MSKKSRYLELNQCSDKFNKIKNLCNDFNFISQINSSIIFKRTFNLALKIGYNVFFSNQLSEIDEFIDQNWFILLEPITNGKLVSAFNQNGTDYFITKNDSIIQSLGKKIMVSINTEKYHVINSFNLFKTHGNKSVEFQIADLNSSKILTRTIKNFTIIEPITNLIIEPYSRSCSVNRVCEFKSKTSSGSDIQYRWIINLNITPFVSDYLSLTFSETGVYLIKLDAWNNISSQSVQINFTVNEGLKEIYFHSGNREMSTSKTNQPALFLFRIKTVQDYMCVVNFGDFLQNFNFTDKEKDFNNKYINHTYLKSGFYSVIITCYHGEDSLSLKLIQVVQDEITGFSLISRGIYISIAFYKIGFRFKTGTDISVILKIDSVTDSNTTFDKTSLNGYSGLLINNGKAKIQNLNIKAFNLVSFVSISDFFEISSSILNPQLIISPFKNNYVYEFMSIPVDYTLRIEKGSNVKVEVFFGNEKNLQPSVNQVFAGEWKSDQVFTYTHSEPGEYIVRVKVSNVISKFDIYKRISFISRVDQLTCQPEPSMALLKFSRAIVSFRIKSIGNSNPGSRTTLKFWPGDSTNLTHGPFMLRMINFTNSVPFFHTYSQLGNYKPLLLIENEISKKYFHLNLMVVSSSVDDMYVVVKPPAVMVNQLFQVYVYILNALNVNITWYFDNITVTQNKLCKLIFFLIDFQFK